MKIGYSSVHTTIEDDRREQRNFRRRLRYREARERRQNAAPGISKRPNFPTTSATVKGLSLTTRYDTSVEFNPSISHASTLKEWVSSNTAAIENVLQTQQYQDPLLLFMARDDIQKLHVSDAAESNNQEQTHWIEGQMQLVGNGPIPYYIGCSSCNRKVDSIEGSTFECMQCGTKEATNSLTHSMRRHNSRQTNAIKLPCKRRKDVLTTLPSSPLPATNK